MRVYGETIHIDYLKNSSLDTSISLLKTEDIDLSQYPIRLVYQNNQERMVSLLTDAEFSAPYEGQKWIFNVENIVSFKWNNNENIIYYKLHDEEAYELLEYWFLHILLPLFYSLNSKYYFFHTGSVLVDDKPILFIAPSFGGKSTMTDYFMKQGHTLVTDDKLATYIEDGKYMAVPSIPFHRPYRKMEDIGLYVENFASKPREIHAIYRLTRVDASENIFIKELKGIEKFSRLHEGSEMNFGFAMKNNVPYLSKLANKIKVFQVDMPWDLDKQEEVYQAIKIHSQNL